MDECYSSIHDIARSQDMNEQNVNFTNKPLEIVSDDFSDPSLIHRSGQLIDPRTDSTFTMIGTGTKDALLSIICS